MGKYKYWEYSVICPDSEAGIKRIFECGEDGWEAVCSWREDRHLPPIGIGGPARLESVNHVLFKRPL